MFRDEKGFSLIQVMIVAGMLGGLSLAFMRIVDNVGQAQRFALSQSDELELRSSIRMILDEKKFCHVSLAGNDPVGSPVTFRKEQVDEDDEGLDVALYYSDQLGNIRTLKKYNGSGNDPTPGDGDFSTFGKLKIKTMKLILKNPPLGTSSPNYDDGTTVDSGIIRVVIEKKTSNGKIRDIVIDFDAKVFISTVGGDSKILSCSENTSSTVNDSFSDEVEITKNVLKQSPKGCFVHAKVGGSGCGDKICYINFGKTSSLGSVVRVKDFGSATAYVPSSWWYMGTSGGSGSGSCCVHTTLCRN